MAQNLLNVTDLDFDQIKQNLIAYFKTQSSSPFRDWNYQGSGLSMLLDVLAYNTHYNAILAHMNVNESFIDTAQLRSSVVSQAKLIGYLPGSAHGAQATLSLSCPVAGGAQSLTIPRGTKFVSTNGYGSFTFVTLNDVTSQAVGGTFTFSNINVVQGTLKTISYLVDSSVPNQRFMIDDSSVDITTLTVNVLDHQNTTASNPYIQFGSAPSSSLGINGVNGTNNGNVYFISQNTQGYYEVSFGDGNIGAALNNLQVVQLSYISTQGSQGNGCSSFSFADSTPVNATSVNVTGATTSIGGSEAESIDSIRFNAPNSLTTQNRAVTANDYVALLLNSNNYGPLINAINVWGGEDETAYDPQNASRYAGQVYICIMPTGGSSTLSSSNKSAIKGFLDTKRVMTVQTNFYDPDYVWIVLNVGFKYNPNLTSLPAATLNTNVYNTVMSYNSSSLQSFTGVFRYSNLTTLIDQTDPSIINTDAKVTFYKTYSLSSFTNSSDVITAYSSIPIGLVTTYGNALAGTNDQTLPMISSSGFTLTPMAPNQSAMTVIGSFSSNSTSMIVTSSPRSSPNPYLIVGATLSGTGITTGSVIVSIDNAGTYTNVTMNTVSTSTQSGSTITVRPPTGTYYLKDGDDPSSSISRRLFLSTNSSSQVAASDPKYSTSGTDIYIGTVYPSSGRVELYTYTRGNVVSSNGTTTQTVTVSSASYNTNQLAGSIFYVVAGTGQYQAAVVTSNSSNVIYVSSSGLPTSQALNITLDASSQYVLITSTIDANSTSSINIYSRPASLDIAPSRHQILQIDPTSTVSASIDTIAVSGITGTNGYQTFSIQ
jgi:hypothetical protein